MENSGLYEQFYLYHCTGDYRSFVSSYTALTEGQLSDDILLLRIKMCQNVEEWDAFFEAIALLKKSTFSESQIKADLYEQCFTFILTNQSRVVAEEVIENCESVIDKFADADLALFAKKIKLYIRSACLTLGLMSSDYKKELIQFGVEAIESSNGIHVIDKVDVLNTILNVSMNQPLPDPHLTLQLFDKYVIEQEMEEKITLQCYINKVRAELRANYHDRHHLVASKLPEPLIDTIDCFKAVGHVCGEALIAGIYGTHLLDLEVIEGIDWTEKSLDTLWHWGHKSAAYGYKQKCVHWLYERGHFDIHDELNVKYKYIDWVAEAPFQKDIEKIRLSNQYFIEGDYEAGRKVVEEALIDSKSEMNNVFFLSLLVNNAAKIQFDTNSLLAMLDKELSLMSGLGKSTLIAQLLVFKALLLKNPEHECYDNVIALYEDIGAPEDVITQLKNRFLDRVISRRNKGTYPILDQVSIDYLSKAESYLSSNVFIANKSTLWGYLYQSLSTGIVLDGRNEDALQPIKTASEYFLEASNLHQYGLNIQHLTTVLIGLARAKNELAYYDEAIENLSKAIAIFEHSPLIDFDWRLKFYMALCYSEPIKNGLINDENSARKKSIEAEKYYWNALTIICNIFLKNSTLESSKRLEASSKVSKDAVQLVSSGFYFFLVGKEWEKCIAWLEKSRAKSVIAAFANKASLNEILMSHPLVLEEKNLKVKIAEARNIDSKRMLQKKVQNVFNLMYDQPLLKNYSMQKQGIIPAFKTILQSIEEATITVERKHVFIYYYTCDDNIYAFGIKPNEDRPLFAKIKLSAIQLKKEMGDSYQLTLKSYHIIKPKEYFWTKFCSLLEPVKQWTNEGDILCIVPYGFLHDLPFHALTIDGNALIVRNPVFYNSSLTSWEYLRRNESYPRRHYSAFIFGDAEKNLEQSNEEAIFVANLIGVKAYINDEVTKMEFLNALNGSSILHFAGHGYFEKDNGLQAAIRLAQNEIITAEEIMNTNCTLDTVVLSACDSGLHRTYAGEERAGLVSAFIASGARNVIASLWPVIDSDAHFFFSIFYPKLLKGTPVVIAMQETMIEMMKREGREQFYHWGAFVLHGVG